MVFPLHLLKEAEALLGLCRVKGLHIATAESCTGGLVSALLTEIPGSSDVVERGFVTYTNTAKHEMLGVPTELLDRVGAVSEEVARSMAEGALRHAPAELSIAITGIAGPGGGTEAKPVGLVHFASARKGKSAAHHSEIFSGNRQEIRLQSVETALNLLRQQAEVA